MLKASRSAQRLLRNSADRRRMQQRSLLDIKLCYGWLISLFIQGNYQVLIVERVVEEFGKYDREN